MGSVGASISLITLFVGEVSRSRSLSYNRIMSVADGDPPLLLLLLPDSSGSVSVSASTSESGFVTIIRVTVVVSFATTRGSAEENVERPIDGRLVRVTVVVSALVAWRSDGGLERKENAEGDIGGETRMVFRRATRIGDGDGEGFWFWNGVEGK